jgi:hypothetical protein
MNRLDQMLDRLPPLYALSEGTLLRQFLEIFATWMAAFDEDMDRVRRSHWIDTAFDRCDIEKIGALFDIPSAPWEPDEFYRSRIKATIAVRLKGAVTRDALDQLLVSLLDGAQKALDLRYCALSQIERVFKDPPAQSQTDPIFVEFVPVIKRNPDLVAKQGLLKPLEKITLVNKSLFRAPLQAVIRGLAGLKTVAPVLVNLTNGNVLGFAGDCACGRELRLTVDGTEKLHATIDDTDVTKYLYSSRGYKPTRDFTPITAGSQLEPLMLERGENILWFFPLALYDIRSLNSGVQGIPSPDIMHGRWGDRTSGTPEGSKFGLSLFEQNPAVSMDLWWEERMPASFRFEVPAGSVLREKGIPHQEFIEQQNRLFKLLKQTVALLRGAGVCGTVEPRPLQTVQRLNDRGRVWTGAMEPEETRVESRLRAMSGLFDSRTLNDSYFT